MLYVAGGETTVTLREPGPGGRNQELALAALPHVHDGALAALATDGVDGASSAAGAIADAGALARAAEHQLDLSEHLQRHRSGAFFAASRAQIVSGPTGTNVADVFAVLPSLPREN